jgi:REP element-mobilizing transposase RayT
MAHSYTALLTHVVFSTKDRRPSIDPSLEERLFPYMGGLIRQLGGKAYNITGAEDHVHLLAQFPSQVALATAIGKVKGCSSKWIHDTFDHRASFAWQRGYGAFSVSSSMASIVAGYIERQKIHHRKVLFQDEFINLLRKHGVPYDESFIWK